MIYIIMYKTYLENLEQVQLHFDFSDSSVVNRVLSA